MLCDKARQVILFKKKKVVILCECTKGMIENTTAMDRFNVSDHNNGTEDDEASSSAQYRDYEETCYRWKVAVLSAMIVATAASNAASLAALAANASRVRRRRLLRQRLQQASLKKHLRPQTAPLPSSSSLPPTRSDLLRRSSSPMPSSSPSATVNSRPPAPSATTTTTTSSSSPAASRMYFFLFHLSVADAMTAPLTLLPELLWTLASPNNHQEESGWNDALCKFTKYVQMLAPYLRYLHTFCTIFACTECRYNTSTLFSLLAKD